MLTNKELEAMIERYDAKAETAYRNYQETGMSRYDRERTRNEDLADALRMALNAADDHSAAVDLRCNLVDLGHRAQVVLRDCDAMLPDAVEKLLRDVAASATARGLIKRDEINWMSF